MGKRCLTITILIAIVFTLNGCNGLFWGKSELDENWGSSFQQAKSSQTLNPDAGKTIQPEKGYDGIAAEHTVHVYQNKFGGSEQKQTVNILKLQ